MKTRSIDICASCGDEKEIAAFGMCFTCYRRAARAAEDQKEAWNPGLKTQRRMQRAYSAMERTLVVECGLSHETADRLIRMVAIQVKPLADYLGEKPPEEEGDVNTGECSRSQETSGEETPKAQAVGESGSSTQCSRSQEPESPSRKPKRSSRRRVRRDAAKPIRPGKPSAKRTP